MNKTKLIFMQHSQLSPRWVENFHLDDMVKEFDVEFWDCSEITRPAFPTPVVIDKPYVVHIKSMEDLDANLRRVPKDSIPIVDIKRCEGNYHIHKTISRYFNFRVYINCFTSQLGEKRGKSKTNTKKQLLTWHIGRNIYRILRKEYYRAKTRKMYHTYTFSSLDTPDNRFRINHPDYERFLRTQSTTTQFAGERYVVYIDNYFPFHTDIRDREPDLDVQRCAPEFYKSLNSFFCRIEKKYDCSVKIASHPTSLYTENPFGNRQILYNQTPELIKDALAVVVHTSGAISYVLLNDKPLAMIYNAAYTQAKREYSRLQDQAEVMHMPLVNTDNELPEGDVFIHIDTELRKRYLHKFLIASEGESNANIFVRYFRVIHDERQRKL